MLKRLGKLILNRSEDTFFAIKSNILESTIHPNQFCDDKESSDSLKTFASDGI